LGSGVEKKGRKVGRQRVGQLGGEEENRREIGDMSIFVAIAFCAAEIAQKAEN
jgi:hypothetical protein